MAPPSGGTDDFTFIMTCLKHAESKPKINFDEVAKETGAKSGTACYHRHWGMMKKWGLAGVSGKGRQPAAASPAKAPASRKRKTKDESSDEGLPAKKAKATGKKKAMQPKVEEVDSEDDIAEEAKPDLKVKVEDEVL